MDESNQQCNGEAATARLGTQHIGKCCSNISTKPLKVCISGATTFCQSRAPLPSHSFASSRVGKIGKCIEACKWWWWWRWRWRWRWRWCCASYENTEIIPKVVALRKKWNQMIQTCKHVIRSCSKSTSPGWTMKFSLSWMSTSRMIMPRKQRARASITGTSLGSNVGALSKSIEAICDETERHHIGWISCCWLPLPHVH